MVSAISSSSTAGLYQPQSNYNSTLTDDQKSTLQEIISKYNPENMTSADQKSMMDEIKAAGINPSKEFGEIMNEAGFKSPERPQGPPPDDFAQGSKEQLPDYLLEFIQKQESGTVTQTDIDSLIQSLENSGSTTSGNLVDQKV